MKNTISIFAVLVISIALLGAGCEVPLEPPIQINEISNTQTEAGEKEILDEVDLDDEQNEVPVDDSTSNDAEKTIEEPKTPEEKSETPVEWLSTDAELTWPQSFNSLLIGSSVNISWKIHNPALKNKPVHLTLVREDDSFVQTIGFVSSAHVLHYNWTVELLGNNQPGKYKIRMFTDDGFSTLSETFSIASPAPEWTSTDAEVTWPQSFNSLQTSSTVNIAWKINKPALNGRPMHILLAKEDGTFVQTIGFVSSANVLHYQWTVELLGENKPGKYKVKLTTDDGFSTLGETFTIAGITNTITQ